MTLVDYTIGGVLAFLMDIIFNVVAWIVLQIGKLLDISVEYFVLDMARLVNDIGAIEGLWQVFRDLGNIVFIGVLIYAAIRTILDIGNSFNTKRVITNLVIVALFVNFSLFATKAIIDSSNVLALQFYNSIDIESCEADSCNISHFFANATNISSVQSSDPITGVQSTEQTSNPNFKITIARIMGTVFMGVTGFVMAAMSLLLIIRFVVLVLLMIFSPLAFIAFILPSLRKEGEKWINKLMQQSFFAPVLFAMIYVVAHLAQGLQEGIAGTGEGSRNLMQAVLSPSTGENFGVILVFIIMIILMAYTLVVAKQFGAIGADKAVQWGKQLRNFGQAKITGAAGAPLRGTVGRAGRWADEKFDETKFSKTAAGSTLQDITTKKVANAKYGSGKSAYEAKKEKKDRESELAKIKNKEQRKQTREDIKSQIDEADSPNEKRRLMNNLSTGEKIKGGKDFLEDNAFLLSESDMEAVNDSDDLSAADKQEIENAANEPLREAAKAEPGELSDDKLKELKAALGSKSDKQIENLDMKEVNHENVVQNMSGSQFEAVIKNRSEEDKKSLIEKKTKELQDAIDKVEDQDNPDPQAVKKLLDSKKDKDIANLLKFATEEQRTNKEVIDNIGPKVLGELADSLKRGEKNQIREAVEKRYSQTSGGSDRYHQPKGSSSKGSSNLKRSYDYLNNGPGNSIY